MKVSFLGTIATLVIVGFISIHQVHAEEKAATDQAAHEGHHPDAKAATSNEAAPMAGHEMMGEMDMSQMKGMMQDCMKTHKDGKMCNHEAMNKCEEKMGKEHCEKMMKKMKVSKKDKK